MPGLVGQIRVGCKQPELVEKFGELCQADAQKSSWGFFPGKQIHSFSASLPDKEGQLLLFGHCIDPESSKELEADQLKKIAVQKGLSAFDNLEGAFQIAWLDIKNNIFYLMNDRLGILPWYWRYSGKSLSFAPKLRPLGGFHREAVSHQALIEFLNAGYVFGGKSFHREINYMKPASILAFHLENGKLVQYQYWKFHYDYSDSYSKMELENELYQAICQSVELLAGESSKMALFMSGGWDSRALMACLHHQGNSRFTNISNGLETNIPFSDTWIAKKISDEYHVPFIFNPREEKWIEKKSEAGIHVSEAITDSSPENFGQNMGKNIFDGFGFIFKGDEVWGWQDNPANERQAIGNVMPNQVNPVLGKLITLSPGEISDLYYDEINKFINDSHAKDFADLKDLLYIYFREYRYIFGLGASDEEWIQVRRPLLSKKVLEVIQKTPPRLRIQKNLFLKMLKHRFPHFFNYGACYTSSIPDYYCFLKEKILKKLNHHILKKDDFDGFFDLSKMQELINQFNPLPTRRYVPNWRLRFKEKMFHKFSPFWYGSKIYQSRFSPEKEHVVAPTDRIIFRLFLLYTLFYPDKNE